MNDTVSCRMCYSINVLDFSLGISEMYGYQLKSSDLEINAIEKNCTK